VSWNWVFWQVDEELGRVSEPASKSWGRWEPLTCPPIKTQNPASSKPLDVGNMPAR
jgi:hypothetical protein